MKVNHTELNIKIINTLLFILNMEKGVSFWGGLFLVKDKPSSLEISIEGGKYRYNINPLIDFTFFSKFRFIIYKCFIEYTKILNSSVHTPLAFQISDGKEFNKKKSLRYILLPKRSILLHGPIKILKDANTSIFLRQGSKNYVYVTAREINITDRLIERIKIFFAFILSRILFFQKVVILFEKKSEKYEESASVLYEKLIDQGRKNVYFIFDKRYSKEYMIPDKYKGYVIDRFSFKHYLKFFQANLIMSSETAYHAVELRTLSRLIHFKLRYMKYKYVFLQHGVMFMVSLDSGTRAAFKYGNMFKENSRIVVSSELEAQHFIDKGSFPKKYLLISGLPKFDKSIKYENADRIVIMPTWRPWEFADSRINPEHTKYYNMLKEMFSAIPKEYKEKVVILPHPLIMETAKNTGLSKYFPEEIKYEEILRNSRLLITDYSSIAYDAFYRGTNVIFWWKEKDACMRNYGGTLMLNSNNVFGDVVYDKENLKKAIERNYTDTQDSKYIKRFKKIVKYSDNKNTERLIKMLEKEKFL